MNTTKLLRDAAGFNSSLGGRIGKATSACGDHDTDCCAKDGPDERHLATILLIDTVSVRRERLDGANEVAKNGAACSEADDVPCGTRLDMHRRSARRGRRRN